MDFLNRSRSFWWRVELLAVPIVFCASALACSSRTMIAVASVQRFEENGWTCRDCDDTADLAAMREAVAAGRRVNMVAWYAEHLVNPPKADTVRIVIAPEGAPLPAPGEPIQLTAEQEWNRIDSLLHRDQYQLLTPRGLFSYERKPLWYWVHVSRSYVTRLDEEGRRMWRRTIPILRLPIWPLTAGDRFVYVSDGLDGAFMVAVELASGRVGTYPLPVETRELWPVGVPSILPYIWGRFVVLPLHREHPGLGGSAGHASVCGYLVVELANSA